MATPKTKEAPTQKQLERIDELVQHPAIVPHYDSLLASWDAKLKNRGSAGWLINWMKGEITRYERAQTAAAAGQSP